MLKPINVIMTITSSTLSKDSNRQVFGEIVCKNTPSEAFRQILNVRPNASLTIDTDGSFYIMAENTQVGPSCADANEAIYHGLASISSQS